MEDHLVQEPIQYFQNLVFQGALSHAYLLTGDVHEQKLKVIQEVMTCLIKQHDLTPEDKARFIQKIEKDQFADCLIIQPEGQTLKIDQIRQLKDWLSTSSMELDFKVAVIESAEKMNVSSSNSLLKLLEEPQRNVYIFLLTSEVSSLLPTIRSRMQHIHFLDLDHQEKKKQLITNDHIAPNHAEVIANLPSNMARDLIKHYDEASFEQYLKVFNYFYKLIAIKDNYAFVVVQTHLKDFFKHPGALEGVEYLLMLNHSVLMYQIETTNPLSLQSYWIKEWLSKIEVDVSTFVYVHDCLLEVKEYLRFNVAPSLAYEKLVINCLKK